MTRNTLMKTKYQVPLFYKGLELIMKSDHTQTEFL